MAYALEVLRKLKALDVETEVEAAVKAGDSSFRKIKINIDMPAFNIKGKTPFDQAVNEYTIVPDNSWLQRARQTLLKSISGKTGIDYK